MSALTVHIIALVLILLVALWAWLTTRPDKELVRLNRAYQDALVAWLDAPAHPDREDKYQELRDASRDLWRHIKETR